MPAKALKGDRHASNEPEYAHQMNARASILGRASRPAKRESDERHGLEPVKPAACSGRRFPASATLGLPRTDIAIPIPKASNAATDP